jgi:hypothetical protein
MKVRLRQHEVWPDISIVKDANYGGGCVVEISEEFLAEYSRVRKEYDILQDKLQDMYNEAFEKSNAP